jgi:type IV pilus assembly protein PilA
MKNVKKNKNVKNNKGFSLVELIVVIAIMAVLVAVLAPQLMGYVEKSREATDIQNLDSIRTQVEAYCADHEGISEITITVNSTKTVVSGKDNASPAVALTDAVLGTDGTNIIGSSISNKLKSGVITELTATLDVKTDKWTYTMSGSSNYYEIDTNNNLVVKK